MVMKGYCFVHQGRPLSVDLVSGHQVFLADSIGSVTLISSIEGAANLINDTYWNTSYKRNEIQIKEVLLVIK